jgi:hypothetical protein
MPSLSNHKRFYVYALVDPRDDAMFYIGKGTGKRKSAHTELVRKGRWDSNGVKCERIEAILVAGLCPIEHVLHSGLSEQEAFRIERETIARTSGLTNICSGVVTADQAALAHVRDMLTRLKSPFEWILDASNKQIEAVTHTWGGHEAALVWFAGSLRELEADLL